MSANTIGADINEIHLAFLLNGKKYQSRDAKTSYNNRERKLKNKIYS